MANNRTLSGGTGRSSSSFGVSTTILIIVLNSVLLLLLQQFFTSSSLDGAPSIVSISPPALSTDTTTSFTASDSSPFGWKIPQGIAIAHPSIPTTEEEEQSIKRSFYGGKGDKAHLGGFTSFDPSGVSPTLWSYMISYLGIRSLLDLGCGRGISTSWFVTHGLDYVVCAEGSHDAVTQSLLPTIEHIPNNTKYDLVEHDFSLGPWWPKQTVDVAWSVEFTEHVGRNFQMNYHTAFRKAALIFVTHSNWGGWHHVEVHHDNWWRIKMESSGFIYNDYLTTEMRKKAKEDSARLDLVEDMKTKGRTHYAVAQHLWTTLQVYINPLVASLPEHQHLFAEHGCYNPGTSKDPVLKGHDECGKKDGETALPASYKALPQTSDMDDQWMALVKDLKLV